MKRSSREENSVDRRTERRVGGSTSLHDPDAVIKPPGAELCGGEARDIVGA